MKVPFLEMLKDKLQIEGQGENVPALLGVGSGINTITERLL